MEQQDYTFTATRDELLQIVANAVNNSIPLGMGGLEYQEKTYTPQDMEQCLMDADKDHYFAAYIDYFEGRCVKLRIMRTSDPDVYAIPGPFRPLYQTFWMKYQDPESLVASVITRKKHVKPNENETQEQEKTMDKKIVKFIIIGVAALIAIVLAFSSFSIISPTQRGVKITLGKAGDTVLQPGLTFKAPFFQSVRKFDLAPKSFQIKFSIGQDAAVTSDMQSVACELSIYWIYHEDRIIDIVNGYSDSSLRDLVQSNALGAIKEVIGKYSIYDIVEKQEEVTRKVEESLVARLSKYPIVISNLTINNWDWSSDFDEQIQNTMRMQQQSRIAAQEVEVAKQEAQKAIVQAQADKEKAEIQAAQKVAVAEQEALAKEKSAQGVANAAKIDADAQAYKQKTIADAEAYAKKVQGEAEASYYQSLLQYADIITTMRQLDIDAQRAENWNGVEVSTYVPLTGTGALVTL